MKKLLILAGIVSLLILIVIGTIYAINILIKIIQMIPIL